MRTIFTTLCLIVTMTLSAAVCPIHQDTPKNIEQRAIKISKSVDRMMDIIYVMYLDGFVSEDELEVLQINYMVIQQNLGKLVE